MLDQLADPDSELSTRHLTHEDLEAYTNGRLAPARLDDCRNHLDSCEACRAELEDLRALKSELAAFPRPQPSRRKLERRKLTLPLVASVTVIFGIVVCTFLWWGHTSHRPNKTAVAAVQVAQSSPAALPAVPASQPTPEQQVAHESAVPPLDEKLDEKPAVAKANTGFTLLSPSGETVSDSRPEFSWEPLPGAVRYSVVIVDAGLHRVERSPRLGKTSWRARRPLRRGRTYLWQVTATLRGGSKVVASAPGTLTVSQRP